MRATPYGRAVLSNALDRVQIAPIGDQHDSLFAAAAGVGQVCAGKWIAAPYRPNP